MKFHSVLCQYSHLASVLKSFHHSHHPWQISLVHNHSSAIMVANHFFVMCVMLLSHVITYHHSCHNSCFGIFLACSRSIIMFHHLPSFTVISIMFYDFPFSSIAMSWHNFLSIFMIFRIFHLSYCKSIFMIAHHVS